ncbi:glycosyltransferase family protein [Pseudanabaena mucicola]|uniref:Glycosyltransferase family 2 protein n=1 Tax=Pseudanabaena mucicola FACHB-723 TaxID=2692860 RepID=A0ABR7ZZS6_9CYAN|nr:glycosyltransferase family 2 protein [Pseudanabaena mucicola]MBD2189000.1 glycosyltransferase family 2 protein [Pseudanabaena mucicola FACHB-723]
MTNTPIVLIVYNRLKQTQMVVSRILESKPSQVFLVADGPKNFKHDDHAKCQSVIQFLEQTNWNCQVFRNYSETNLGCKIRTSTGLDWVFSQVDSAIIFDDDCLPDHSFFPFCEELLEKYRDDQRIFAISGDNFQDGRKRNDYSYYYSLYPHVWGWATWRRAWQHYDGEMKLWETARDEGWLNDILQNDASVKYWKYKLQQTHKGKFDDWGYPWTLSCWMQSGLTILPNQNLVSNIGFDRESSTHTKNKNSPFANMPTETMQFPLRHPPFVVRDRQADDFTHKKLFSLWSRVKNRLREYL